MSTNLPRRRTSTPSLSDPWGQANTLRGRSYAELAVAFVLDFPIGASLSARDFDRWAAAHDPAYVIPDVVDTKSDAWLALTQRRHQFHANLNKAAAHPRMNDPGSPGAYFVAILSVAMLGKKGKERVYHVEAPIESIAKHEITVRTTSFVAKKRRDLGYLLQSQDWDQLPPYEKLFAETLYDDIEHFEKSVRGDGEDLQHKFRKLASRIAEAVKQGKISPTNGGIRRILESHRQREGMPDDTPSRG